jgi:hypothetical protein
MQRTVVLGATYKDPIVDEEQFGRNNTRFVLRAALKQARPEGP